MPHPSVLVERVFQGLPDAVIVARSDGTVALINAAAERLLGWSSVDLVGSTASNLFVSPHPTATPCPIAQLAHLIRTAPGDQNAVLRHRNGAKIPVTVALADLTPPAPGPAPPDLQGEGWVVVVRPDIGGRPPPAGNRETQDLDKDDRKGFLSVLSHELRTPLNVIIGFSEILANEMFGGLSARYGDYAKAIHDSGNALLDRINDLLQLADIESGQVRLSPDLVHLPTVVATVCQRLHSLAADRCVTIKDRTPTTLPLVDADPRALDQVLRHLVDNAIKFSPPGRDVTLSAGVAKDGGLTLSVTDSGQGIPDTEMARLFRPFEQLDMSLARIQGGIGLGLALSKGLVELHGGSLALRSQPDVGTVVTVTLPAVRVHAARHGRDWPGGGQPGGGQTVPVNTGEFASPPASLMIQ